MQLLSIYEIEALDYDLRQIYLQTTPSRQAQISEEIRKNNYLPLSKGEYDSLTDLSRITYDSLDPEAMRIFALAYRYKNPENAVENKTEDAPSSLMRFIGMLRFWLSIVAFFIGVFGLLSGNGLLILSVYLASAVGLFAFMWMLGAIEQRLIDINQTLKSKASI